MNLSGIGIWGSPSCPLLFFSRSRETRSSRERGVRREEGLSEKHCEGRKTATWYGTSGASRCCLGVCRVWHNDRTRHPESRSESWPTSLVTLSTGLSIPAKCVCKIGLLEVRAWWFLLWRKMTEVTSSSWHGQWVWAVTLIRRHLQGAIDFWAMGRASLVLSLHSCYMNYLRPLSQIDVVKNRFFY